MLAGLLWLQGHAVVCLRDGIEAMSYLKSHEAPGVLLMDMLTPNRDGGTAIRRIRKDDRYAGMRIFGISGSEPSDNALEIGDEGVNRWFRKPLNPQFLVDAI